MIDNLPKHVSIVSNDYILQKGELEEKDFITFLQDHFNSITHNYNYSERYIKRTIYIRGYLRDTTKIKVKVVLNDQKNRILKKIYKIDINNRLDSNRTSTIYEFIGATT